ncbi:MAG: 30S ribosomal protein S15 [candidate division TM6 bacterium GW2011_GWE2_41_16]|nr:MAG: 30S ribosomal protein S15 [candidate division TM6 bacterium GW2011_GWE2_41_16]
MNIQTKQDLIGKHSVHAKDTGSTQVQIALLTERIKELNQKHLAHNKHDQSARFGLLKLVGKRRSLLSYLKRTSESTYYELINKLDIRK